MLHRFPTRRQFLRCASASLLAGSFCPVALRAAQRKAAHDRISIGIIGLGSRGFNLLDEFLAQPDVQITAICDVHDIHYRDHEWGKGPQFGREPARAKIEKKYAEQTRSGSWTGLNVDSDPRVLLARNDLDAVVIATPDHWHAWCTLEALKNGKDVYCEKPVTHLFHEGQQVYREVSQRKAVFQTGSQQRSDPLFQRAVEIVRNGHLGKITEVAVGLPPGYEVPQASTEITSPPVGLDYDLWCGPAPKLPYMRARHHRWWRGNRAYGGGVLMDWIGHHNDIAQWALGVDRSGPTKVKAIDWTFPETDVYDTPFHYTIRCEYPGDVVSTISSANPLGTKWIGEDGWLHVTRGRMTASDRNWLAKDFNPGDQQIEHSPGHVRNFLECIKSRKECIAPAEVGHRSITPGHLGYVSQTLGRSLNWNPAQEVVVSDDEANQLLQSIHYRSPWATS